MHVSKSKLEVRNENQKRKSDKRVKILFKNEPTNIKEIPKYESETSSIQTQIQSDDQGSL